MEGSSGSSADTTSNESLHPTIQNDLDSYQRDCERDPALQSFDSKLKKHTRLAINSLGTGTPDRSQFFHLLVRAQDSILTISKEVVSSIINSRENVMDEDFSSLVNLYFENSKKILEFRNAVKSCVQQAKHKEFIIRNALEQFERERETEMQRDVTLRRYNNTLNALEQFTAADNPINQDFLGLLESMFDEQSNLINKLNRQKEKLEKELRDVRRSRMVWNFIFGAAFASVVIIGLVVVAMPISPVMAAGAAMASSRLAASFIKAGKWSSDSWNEYEQKVKDRLRTVNRMLKMEKYGTLTYIPEIRELVKKLDISINAIQNMADFAVRLDEDEVVKNAMEGIMKELNEFTNDIDALERYADKCFEEIMTERDIVRRHILSQAPPSSPSGGGSDADSAMQNIRWTTELLRSCI